MTRRPLVLSLVPALLVISLAAPALAQSPSSSPWPEPVPSAGVSPDVEPSLPPALPSPAGAPELEARFPAEIGGVPLTIESFNGADLEAQFTADMPGTAVLLETLGTQGKAIADLSVASASVETDAAFAAIIALQVNGADAAGFIDGFASLVIGWEDIERTELQLGGKDVVRIVPSASGPSVEPIHAYVQGDTLWFVQSQEPLLGEVFTALP